MRDPIEAFFRRLREEDARVPSFASIPKQKEKKSVVKYKYYCTLTGFTYVQAIWQDWTVYVASYKELTQARIKYGTIFLPTPFQDLEWSPTTILTHKFNIYKSQFHTYNKYLPKELHFKQMFSYEGLYNDFKKRI